jgi:peptidoglycan hydrolase-like protein with peptidoglycan-binding domain
MASEKTYLLIKAVTADGAIVVDRAGKSRDVLRDFILQHCDGAVSWFLPYYDGEKDWKLGMSGPDVVRFQQILQTNGYSVTITGSYDHLTAETVQRFQGDFGLRPDGIIGVRTRGLLYQMGD